MKNKFLHISLVVNILLVIAMITLLICSKSPRKTTERTGPDSPKQEFKFESSGVFKKLSFLSNQSFELIKKDTSIVEYNLPAPMIESSFSVEKALFERRSRRGYKPSGLLPIELSQLLWAAYGVTYPFNKQGDGLKTSPSADAKYPLSIYVLIADVKGLPAGVYKYIPAGHKLIGLINKDKKTEICQASDNQIMIKEAPVVLVYTAKPENKEEITIRWTNMEVGHSAQNVYLQSTALNLGTCAIGWFNEDKVRDILEVPANEQILYMMPVGHTIN